jgi:pantothenate kinase type III
MRTCVTFDFINENDKYLGGAIAPGLQLRYKSCMILLQVAFVVITKS